MRRAGFSLRGASAPQPMGEAKASRRLKPAPRSERGFALLIIFLMAAAVALMLYSQLPRVAFESEREKEQTLIDRGELYKRAIQMYVVEYKKYPAKIEDLENTNNKRYLRKRYIDPMTGKDEWRLIHVNGMGQLTDSVVTKPPQPGQASGASGASGATGALAANVTGASGASGADGTPQVNQFVAQRPSDRTFFSGPGGQLPPGAQPPNVDPNDPRYWPPITLLPSGATGAAGAVAGVPGQQIPGQQIPGQQIPGQQIPGQQNALPGQQNIQIGPNGQIMPVPGLPGQGINLQTGSIQPTQQPGNPQNAFNNNNSFGTPAPGAAPNAAPNNAVGMINDMLRNPQAPPTAAANNPLGAGGLAGVATPYKGPSIKIYKDHQKYQEWEFIFDLKQNQPTIPQPQQQTLDGSQQNPNAQTANPTSPINNITPVKQ